MEKHRLQKIALSAAFIAPPLAAFFDRVFVLLMSLATPSSPELNANAWQSFHLFLPMVFSYIYGFVPAAIVAFYGMRMLIKTQRLHYWKSYVLALCLSVANSVIIEPASADWLVPMIVGMTITFEILYRQIKRLLPSAGFTLIASQG